MIANLNLKIVIIVLAYINFPNILAAKQMEPKQPAIDFLAEKVVFCHSRESLTSYKNMVDMFDVDGMNGIALAGECDFVPDGKYLVLQKFRCYAIKSTNITAAAVQGITLWTFESLVSSGNPNYSQTFFDTISNLPSKQGRVRCP